MPDIHSDLLTLFQEIIIIISSFGGTQGQMSKGMKNKLFYIRILMQSV